MSTRRKPLRLPEYDYSEPGGYFITIVTYDRERLFGEIVNGEMRLNDYGKIIEEEWARSAIIRMPWEFDTHVVMPDHFHGVLTIVERDPPIVTVGAHSCAPLRGKTGNRRPLSRPPRSLGSFVAGFKSACTARINTIRNTPGQPIWQRNYYEHVIRDDKDLDEICASIEGNPACWETDDPFPLNKYRDTIVSRYYL
jgi:REP element-mobilizing transposase RayT